jgi:hypothetical protein
MRKRILLLTGVIFFLTSSFSLGAQGGAAALQFSMGRQGSISFFEAGVVFPSLGYSMFVGLKARTNR